MDYDYIRYSILNVFAECELFSFPLNCFEVFKHYKISAYPYSELDEPLREYCLNYSNDALNYRGKICYNDKMQEGRIRFSLMHELGHVILKHGESPSKEQEKEADFFASHTLAPRMAIHYAKCKNQNDVAKLFRLSQEAAQYAFDDYRRWYRRTVYHKMNDFDKAMYAHFYNHDANCFVYNIKSCAYCNSMLYNSSEIICKRCSSPIHSYLQHQQQDDELLIAESQWLYGGL